MDKIAELAPSKLAPTSNPCTGSPSSNGRNNKYERQYDRAFRAYARYQDHKRRIERQQAQSIMDQIQSPQPTAEYPVHAP